MYMGGSRVRDGVLAAGFEEHGTGDSVVLKHFHFANDGGKTHVDEWYGGSIPLKGTMDPALDVILAVNVRMRMLTHIASFPLGLVACLLTILLLGRR
jgi:hypothetical protein